jgi:hypothetical protein
MSTPKTCMYVRERKEKREGEINMILPQFAFQEF